MSISGTLLLTSDELRELTDLKIPKAQMRWLNEHQFPYEVSASGKPKVLRAFLVKRLDTFNTSSKQLSEPNFDSIR